MNLLTPYVEEHGKERVAEELTALLGRPVTPTYVRLVASQKKNPPKAWAEALGLASPVAAPTGAPLQPDRDGASPDPGQAEPPPRAPEGAALIHPVPADFARKRIASAYALVGSGLGSSLGNDGITRVWDDHSEPIAAAWIEAARTNEFARRFVEFMTAGGPMGEVVVLHITLVAGTLYVIGQFPDVGLFGKYARYRPAAPPPPSEPEPSHDARAEHIVHP